jgi:hypothetical protein
MTMLSLRAVLLDTGPLGLLAHPKANTEAVACRVWAAEMTAAGVRIVIPEIADYEVRRELLQAHLSASLRVLDLLVGSLDYLPLDTPTLRQAAQFWAQARQAGRPTADPGRPSQCFRICARTSHRRHWQRRPSCPIRPRQALAGDRRASESPLEPQKRLECQLVACPTCQVWRRIVEVFVKRAEAQVGVERIGQANGAALGSAGVLRIIPDGACQCHVGAWGETVIGLHIISLHAAIVICPDHGLSTSSNILETNSSIACDPCFRGKASVGPDIA